MSKRQKPSRNHFDNVTLRKKNGSRNTAEPDISPLLIIKSSTYKDREWQSKKTYSFHEEDTLEIKDLSQSPRSARCSMFHFSPSSSPTSPGNSPTLSHKQLSDESSISQDSMNTTCRAPVSPTLSERRRYMVISEIISTEAKYIDSLNIILSTFLPALETVVSPRSLRQLIPAQLEQLIESHEEILGDLKHRLSSETEDYGYVGDVFSRLCSPSNIEFFNMYRVYMGEFKIAMKTLATYESESREFKDILNVLQQGPLCERLNLASYLLTPVQRLPRYELLLKELLKYTPAEHPDNFYVMEALGRLHRELTKLNQSIKSCQMVCSANNRSRSGRVRFNQSTHNLSRKTTRRAKRTLSMLKRFVSTPNIDDLSSGESSLAEDALSVPRFQRRRNAVTSSVCTSEVDLTSSIDKSDNTNVSSRIVLSDDNRAVSCSDLRLEFEEKKKNSFRVLSPLPSEACTPASMVSSKNTSRPRGCSLPEGKEFSLNCQTSLYSSNSSLSSDDHRSFRGESLTPTEESFRALRGAVFSTPILRGDNSADDEDLAIKKDVTLKYSSARNLDTSIILAKQESTDSKEDEEDEEEEEEKINTIPQDITVQKSTDSNKKATWRKLMGRKLKLTKKSKPSEIKYHKNYSCET